MTDETDKALAGEPPTTYFAVQLKPMEHPVRIAEAFVKAAHESGTLFRRLEVLDTITIGATAFVRMRSEITNLPAILDSLYKGGKGVVNAAPGMGGAYVLRMPGGRVGKVSNLVMNAIPKLGQTRTFRGTQFKFWERQFEAA